MHHLSEYYAFLEDLMQQLEALHPAIAAATSSMNARGDTEVEHLQDVEVRAQEIALHGVRVVAANVLASAQLRSKIDLFSLLMR